MRRWLCLALPCEECPKHTSTALASVVCWPASTAARTSVIVAFATLPARLRSTSHRLLGIVVQDAQVLLQEGRERLGPLCAQEHASDEIAMVHPFLGLRRGQIVACGCEEVGRGFVIEDDVPIEHLHLQTKDPVGLGLTTISHEPYSRIQVASLWAVASRSVVWKTKPKTRRLHEAMPSGSCMHREFSSGAFSARRPNFFSRLRILECQAWRQPRICCTLGDCSRSAGKLRPLLRSLGVVCLNLTLRMRIFEPYCHKSL